jgi:hypothetical protein
LRNRFIVDAVGCIAKSIGKEAMRTAYAVLAKYAVVTADTELGMTAFMAIPADEAIVAISTPYEIDTINTVKAVLDHVRIKTFLGVKCAKA